MYAPYPENMMESIKKVEATRAARMATEPRRLTAEEKDALLREFHPDRKPDAFAEIKIVASQGKTADYDIKVGDTIKVGDIDAEIIKIKMKSSRLFFSLKNKTVAKETKTKSNHQT